MRCVVAAVLLVTSSAHADGKPPRGATSIAIDYTYASFHHNELHYRLDWKGTSYRSDANVLVDGALVEALYASLINLKPFDDALRCISHTDDYPHFTITITGDAPIVIDSDSNCHANVPWNVIQNGKHSAQFTTEISKAVRQLLAKIDAKTWSNGADSPEAWTDFGGEVVEVGQFMPHFARANPAAMACVRDLQTSEVVKKVFGASPTVTELSLECELSEHPDCAQLTAASAFVWDGVSLELGLPCDQGVIAVSPVVVDRVAELRTFVESKPMRLLVKMSSDPPRVWGDREWRSEGAFVDAPMITFRSGDKTMHIRAIGDHGPGAIAYLKALGIDPHKVTKHRRGDPFDETDLDVDFDGKLVVANAHR